MSEVLSWAKRYGADANHHAITIGDFDGDGHPDLATANVDTNNMSLLFNQGAGTFAAPVDYATDVSPIFVTNADLKGDGKRDLVIAIAGRTLNVFLNGPGNVLAGPVSYFTGANPESVAIGDLDGDGRPDLAVAAFFNVVSILFNRGAGAFATSVDYTVPGNPSTIAMADYNGDGKPDLALGIESAQAMAIMLNTGAANFTPAARFALVAGNPITMPTAEASGARDADSRPCGPG